MNKKKSIVIVLILIVMFFFIKEIFLKPNPKEFVIHNREELTTIADELLGNLNDKIDVYREKSECPNVDNVDKLYLLSVNRIAVEKLKDYYEEDCVDRVVIFLKDKPEDEEYFQCGIYYSPEGCAIDYYGHPVEDIEGVYIYDGRPKKVKIMYRSEKICDNWYYFEDAVW
ncbi:hypothetical protein SAMN04487829_2723 [Pseudobutyrivibrio sp. NOR37]|nr:hypothetical protein [Pseudobutyrivibrio sp. NOR37]SFR86415.1 hypothetical protein SAMN04487829_2723 [Pseudobutyrivibrio sp. NOR37]